MTSFALYEAYGTRPYEWGDDPDRQKANTKEEESDLNLLNEGMRFRDLETGVFLTRDPIGYGDGPNVYCYVHCNPITSFDPLGLTWNPLINRMLNHIAASIDNAVVASGRPSSFAAMVSSGLEGMAYSGSATQAKDMYNGAVDRTSAVMEQQMDMGESGLKSATVGISALVGDAVGYTPLYEGVSGNDVATQETLSTGERVRRGVQGTSQLVLTGTVLAARYNGAAQTGRLSQTATPEFVQGTQGTSGELTTVRGNTYQGNSTGSSASGGTPRAPMNSQTQQALDLVKKPSRSHGHCAEIDAVNKALNASDDVQGAVMGPVKLNESGRVLPACSTCREVKTSLGVD